MLEESPLDDRVSQAAVQRLLRQGGESMLQAVMRAYADRFGERVAELGAALEARDAKEAERLAHSLRSSSELIGVLALGRLFGALELEAKEPTWTAARSVADVLTELEAAFGEVRAWIERWTGR